MSKLGKIAEGIKELRHGKDANIPSAVMFAFFDLVADALAEIDKSLDELKKNSTNVKCHCHSNSKIVEKAQEKTR